MLANILQNILQHYTKLVQLIGVFVAMLFLSTVLSMRSIAHLREDFLLLLLISSLIRFLFAAAYQLFGQSYRIVYTWWATETILIFAFGLSDIDFEPPLLVVCTLYILSSLFWVYSILSTTNEIDRRQHFEPWPKRFDIFAFWVATITLAATVSLLRVEHWFSSFYVFLFWSATVGLITFTVIILKIETETVQLIGVIVTWLFIMLGGVLLPDDLRAEIISASFVEKIGGQSAWAWVWFGIPCFLWYMAYLDVYGFRTRILFSIREWLRNKFPREDDRQP